MATNKRIQTTELDFDGIKQNLRNYLQGQKEFSDYDFEGSALSILLDVLALNTHYNALYTNLALNESFIDSASKRSSVVSIAHQLGYRPSSSVASTALVAVSMINNEIDAPALQDIPIFTPFTAQVDNTAYTFYTTSYYTTQRNGNVYLFNNVELKEGTFLSYRYTVGADAFFSLPNTGIDTSTITVTVQETAESTVAETFSESTTVLNLDGNSPVYFLKEMDDETYQIEFGDGTIGKALSEGNVVNVRYLVCNQDRANGAGTFTWAGSLPANTSIYVSTTARSFGGAAPENIDSVRWNAPRAYAAQNRCVTTEDYITTIKQLFAEAQAVTVWGGENNDPPQYGKVFISIIPRSTAYLSQAQKDFVIDEILAPRKALTAIPEILDPAYIRVQLDTAYYYNPAITTRSAEDITTLVQQAINNYNDTYLNSFGSVFKFSKLSSIIDGVEPSITSNITTLKLHRDVSPQFNIPTGYSFNIGNPIYNAGVPEESVLSSGFYTDELEGTPVYIDDIPTSEDNPVGTLRLFYYSAAGVKVIIRNVGTVNYLTGVINVDRITVTGLYDLEPKWVIKPQSNDVVSLQNQFVVIDPKLTTITPVIDTPSKTYQFTSSRN